MQLQKHEDVAFEDLPPHLGAVAIMGGRGDIKYTWDPSNPEDVEAAREHFKSLKAKGYIIFRMKRWRKGERRKTFHPEDGRMLAVPPKAKKKAKADTADGEMVKKADPKKADHYVAVPPMQGG